MWLPNGLENRPGTIRNWCIEHGIGRRVGGGPWIVSKVALETLRHYKAGDRTSDCIVAYFKREGLEGLLEKWAGPAKYLLISRDDLLNGGSSAKLGKGRLGRVSSRSIFRPE